MPNIEDMKGKYRKRTWLRMHSPWFIANRIPKGTKNCESHEWYPAEEDTWRCAHCVVGVVHENPFSDEYQLSIMLQTVAGILENTNDRDLSPTEQAVAKRLVPEIKRQLVPVLRSKVFELSDSERSTMGPLSTRLRVKPPTAPASTGVELFLKTHPDPAYESLLPPDIWSGIVDPAIPTFKFEDFISGNWSEQDTPPGGYLIVPPAESDDDQEPAVQETPKQSQGE